MWGVHKAKPQNIKRARETQHTRVDTRHHGPRVTEEMSLATVAERFSLSPPRPPFPVLPSCLTFHVDVHTVKRLRSCRRRLGMLPISTIGDGRENPEQCPVGCTSLDSATWHRPRFEIPRDPHPQGDNPHSYRQVRPPPRDVVGGVRCTVRATPSGSMPHLPRKDFLTSLINRVWYSLFTITRDHSI